MCDTLVALGNSTEDGSVLFAKNSDRDPNEAHELVTLPHTTHPDNSTVRCTYVDIPQVRETNAILLAKPFWIWGAEIGTNEHGVVIGNEAVFTKIPVQKEPGLIGMDFLRLALERASTSGEAVDVITNLLETYGQGGNCGFTHEIYYHNGFLIADPKEAWVLETADRHWAAEKVRDVRSISNRITIGSEFDLASENLVKFAIDRGWCKNREDFNFGRCYSDFVYTRFSASNARYCRTSDLLNTRKGKLRPADMMTYLRDHGPNSMRGYSPDRGLTGADVCMHANFGPIRVSQSVGSMVSHLKDGKYTHWLTGTSAPCTGIFKPVWLDSGLPDLSPSPKGTYDNASLWWRHEVLHRSVLRDYTKRLTHYIDERDQLEQEIINQTAHFIEMPMDERRSFTAECFERADQETTRWIGELQLLPIEKGQTAYHKLAWWGADRQGQFKI